MAAAPLGRAARRRSQIAPTTRRLGGGAGCGAQVLGLSTRCHLAPAPLAPCSRPSCILHLDACGELRATAGARYGQQRTTTLLATFILSVWVGIPRRRPIVPPTHHRYHCSHWLSRPTDSWHWQERWLSLCVDHPLLSFVVSAAATTTTTIRLTPTHTQTPGP